MNEKNRERPIHEIVETLLSVEADFDTSTMCVSLDVMQAKFSDGYVERPYLQFNISRSRNDRTHSLNIRVNDNGDDDNELDFLFEAIENAAQRIPYEEKMNKYAADWNKAREEEKAKAIEEHNEFVAKKVASQTRDKNVGTGLGRFSKKSKSERKRERSNPEKQA